MKASLNTRVARLETSAEEAHLATLRQTIADLEQRKVELLADLTTLEAAIAAMQQYTRSHGVAGTKDRGGDHRPPP